MNNPFEAHEAMLKTFKQYKVFSEGEEEVNGLFCEKKAVKWKAQTTVGDEVLEEKEKKAVEKVEKLKTEIDEIMKSVDSIMMKVDTVIPPKQEEVQHQSDGSTCS